MQLVIQMNLQANQRFNQQSSELEGLQRDLRIAIEATNAANQSRDAMTEELTRANNNALGSSRIARDALAQVRSAQNAQVGAGVGFGIGAVAASLLGASGPVGWIILGVGTVSGATIASKF